MEASVETCRALATVLVYTTVESASRQMSQLLVGTDHVLILRDNLNDKLVCILDSGENPVKAVDTLRKALALAEKCVEEMNAEAAKNNKKMN
jgi:hypothetical protein